MKPEEKKQVSDRAKIDQIGAQLVDLAPALAKFHKTLIDNGMDDKNALELVRSWLQMQIMRSTKDE